MTEVNTQESGSSKKLSSSLGKVLLAILALIIICAGVLVAMDYLNYKNDEHSLLFKQKTMYSQNETVNIGKLSVQIVSAKREPGAKGSYIPCQLSSGYQSIFGYNNAFCTNGQEYVAPAFDGDAIFKLSLKIHNGASNFVSLNEYKFSVIANTSIDNPSIRLKSSQILANSDMTTDYWSHLDNGYNGTYSLVIKHHAVQKTVAITKY